MPPLPCLHDLREEGSLARVARQAATTEIDEEGVALCGQRQGRPLEAHSADNLQQQMWCTERGEGPGP